MSVFIVVAEIPIDNVVREPLALSASDCGNDRQMIVEMVEVDRGKRKPRRRPLTPMIRNYFNEKMNSFLTVN